MAEKEMPNFPVDRLRQPTGENPMANREDSESILPFDKCSPPQYRFPLGIRWEDIIISARPTVAEAMELADSDVIKGRMRRLKRASDLCYKGKIYTDYKTADNLEPFKFELWDDVQKIQAREDEYALLDLHKK